MLSLELKRATTSGSKSKKISKPLLGDRECITKNNLQDTKQSHPIYLQEKEKNKGELFPCVVCVQFLHQISDDINLKSSKRERERAPTRNEKAGEGLRKIKSNIIKDWKRKI